MGESTAMGMRRSRATLGGLIARRCGLASLARVLGIVGCVALAHRAEKSHTTKLRRADA